MDPVAARPALMPELVIQPESVEEALTPIENHYLRMVKAEADRVLQQGLSNVIVGHGHNAEDGRNYNFVDDTHGGLVLQISQTK